MLLYSLLQVNVINLVVHADELWLNLGDAA